LELIWYYR